MAEAMSGDAAWRLWKAYRQAMLDADADALADLYAADAVHEFPLFNPYFPRRLDGRDAIRRHYGRVWGRGLMRIVDLREVSFQPASGGHGFIAEAAYTAEAVASGARFDLGFIVVASVEQGLISHLRDYMDALGAAVGLGAVQQMVSAIEARSGTTAGD
jgi:ketosteroid isomerase-like protein